MMVSLLLLLNVSPERSYEIYSIISFKMSKRTVPRKATWGTPRSLSIDTAKLNLKIASSWTSNISSKKAIAAKGHKARASY